jgi:tryptophan-rich sensory protein
VARLSGESLVTIPLLFACVGICLGAGYTGSVFTTPEIPGWYTGLQKPALSPPPWIFAPVWTVLYILMGISLCLMLTSGRKTRDIAIAAILFFVQLAANVAWSYLFFGLHSVFLGLLCLVALLGILLCTIVQSFRVSIASSLLLVPYLLWTCIALYLNYSFFILNPGSFHL